MKLEYDEGPVSHLGQLLLPNWVSRIFLQSSPKDHRHKQSSKLNIFNIEGWFCLNSSEKPKNVKWEFIRQLICILRIWKVFSKPLWFMVQLQEKFSLSHFFIFILFFMRIFNIRPIGPECINLNFLFLKLALMGDYPRWLDLNYQKRWKSKSPSLQP